jgi:hypothetical protein
MAGSEKRSSKNALSSILGIGILLATVCFGSQALVLTNSPKTSGIGQLPSSGPYSRLGDWRIEGQADSWSGSTADVGLFEVDSSLGIQIIGGTTLKFYGYASEGVGVSIKSMRAFRWVAQRNTASGKYTLEVWDQTSGDYAEAETPISDTRALDKTNYKFSIGSFYEAAAPDIRIGFLRWYSTTRPLAAPPPAIVLAGSPGDLLDFEFEGNLNDSSPNGIKFSFSSGKATYAKTASYPPAVNLSSVPLTVRAGVPLTIDATASFSNTDSPILSCSWTQTTGAYQGSWIDQNRCVSKFTPPVFGTYGLVVAVTDTSGQASQQVLKVGAVATDDQGVVIVADPRINEILGPMIAYGANPWSWFDNRQKVTADNQLSLMDTVWSDFWNTPNPNGTVSVAKGSKTVTGSETQFQSDVCGGAGNTSPTATAGEIYIWYPSSDYPGQSGRGRYYIASCDSQTQITLTQPFLHSGNASRLPYTISDPNGQTGPWLYSPIPGNYYDNVLAFYNLYYRTGVDSYLTAARTLASRWWTGPNFDLGKSLDTSQVGGAWIAAGPARGMSPTGLVAWGLDPANSTCEPARTNPAGMARGGLREEALSQMLNKPGTSGSAPLLSRCVDIWPGLRHLWDYNNGLVQPNIVWGQIGDIREAAYITATAAICALNDPDASQAAKCAATLTNAVENWWQPLEVRADGAGSWRNTAADVLFSSTDRSVYVTTTTGDPVITLNGGTWNISTFTQQGASTVNVDKTTVTQTGGGGFNPTWGLNGAMYVDINGTGYRVASVTSATSMTLATSAGNLTGATMTPLERGLWFLNDPGNVFLGGSQDSQVGDSVFYRVQSVRDSTHLVLTSGYTGSGGKHGLLVGHLVGFGTIPYMLGLAAGVFGHYAYDAFTALHQTGDAQLVKQFATDAATWLSSPIGFDSNQSVLFVARAFMNCEPVPANDAYCAAGAAINGEAMRGFSAAYALSGDPNLRRAGDAFYQALWCKPTGGWKCPSQPTGNYLWDIDDAPVGYMINSQSLSNKWLGFFFGYGFGSGWPAARLGGVAPPSIRTRQVPINLPPTIGASALITVVQPSGAVTQTTCSLSPCEVNVDARQGSHIVKVDIVSASGAILTPGTFSVLSSN